MRIDTRLTTETIDAAAELGRFTKAASGAGAVVSFTGLCRDEGGTLSALELEHYPGMAEAEIGRVAAEAVRRWPLTGLTVIHRHGLLRPGDNIVLVAAASSHRRAAFEAADFLMDFLKSQAPFWKKEHRAHSIETSWVEAKAEDDEALLRWAESSNS